MSAQTADGQPIEVLTILDGYTLECLSISAERIMSLENFIDRLFDLFVLREVPKQIVLRGVPALVSRAVAEWLSQLPVETTVATAGSRWEEDGTGAFSARLRDEVLASQTFTTLPEARALMGNWRRQYNETRPQRSPLEDEPQAPQGGDAAAFALEYRPPLLDRPCRLKTPARGIQHARTRQASEKWPAPRTAGMPGGPGGSVYPAKVAEYVGIVLVFVLHDCGGAGDAGAPLRLAGGHGPVRQHGTGAAGGMRRGDQACQRRMTSRWATSSPSALPPTGKLMSHRVVAVLNGESYQFRTKGDANEDVDPYVVPAENVVGRSASRSDMPAVSSST